VTENSQPAVVAPAQQAKTSGLVLRNALLLMIAQAVATPMAIVVNAVMARYLGPQEFGYIYLAGTFISFGFLAVDWGQSGMLPMLISRSRDSAGLVLGSALGWKLLLAPLVYAVLAVWFMIMDYSPIMQVVLALAFLGTFLGSLGSAYQEAVRGFERTDVAATTQVLGAFSSVVVVVPVLLLGGRLKAVLLAQAFCSLLPLLIAARALRSMGVRKLSFSRSQVKSLVLGGTPFLAFGLAMALQPSIDAGVLSKLGSMEAVGWHAAARKLVGVLATPAVALISALYPTLSRLFTEDLEGFKRTTRDALRTATILAAPLALGTFLYPDVGVRIFSRESFGPAEDNLRIFAPFIFLLYFSMPLGACLAAAGQTKPWAAAQGLCVVMSAIVDPLLVPYFQTTRGNGGLGVCFATLASEVLMVGAALVLVPKGILDRELGKTLLRTALAGGAMVVVAWLLSSITPFVAAPLAVVTYLACLWGIGGLDADQIATFRSIIARKRRKS
jgi:O-antigen/teichoic acid export membrane protein